jgi:histidine triad (HIT) family protein
MNDCTFCGIVAGTEPAQVVWRWGDAVAFLPFVDEWGCRDCTEGHLLVVPIRHVADASEDYAVTGMVAARAAELATLTYISDFHLITNCGPWADQTEFHLHWHIVPRRENDGLVMPWTAQQKRTEGRHA